MVGPRQFFGLEVNPLARELASIVVWIGYLQWMNANGYTNYGTPILERLENIQQCDALLETLEDGTVLERSWPRADFIIGNPPFLGDKKMRSELGDVYVTALRHAFKDRIPGQADFVCYWFEKARAQIESGVTKRAGLISTNSIRGGKNRVVLERIQHSGGIFYAWSDRSWVLDGAAVRVSMIGFDNGDDKNTVLDGVPVPEINADLSSTVSVSSAKPLLENAGISFIGIQKGGNFDVPDDIARAWLRLPNPNGKSNAEVIKPYMNGMDVVRRSRGAWLIDFNEMPLAEASEFIAPFTHVLEHVKPDRDKNNRDSYRERWWLHHELRPAMRKALQGLERYIITPTVAKHRIWSFVNASVLPDKQLVVVARDDGFTFGVLQSRVHEVWTLKQGTSLGIGNDPRYTSATCFETFAFPRPTTEQRTEIEKWAKYLDDVRRALLQADDQRTLTGMYNDVTALRKKRDSAHPVYALVIAHEKLDKAVHDAYGWDYPLSDDDILARLLALNLERSMAQDRVPDESIA